MLKHSMFVRKVISNNIKQYLLLEKTRKQQPVYLQELSIGLLQVNSTVVNCKEDTVGGVDDVHGILYMLLFISLICMAVPQPSKPGFLDSELKNFALEFKIKEHEH